MNKTPNISSNAKLGLLNRLIFNFCRALTIHSPCRSSRDGFPFVSSLLIIKTSLALESERSPLDMLSLM
jgi:hypothetical protein